MKKIFITATGTNIGKTLFTCAFAKAIKESKKTVSVIKPVISGFNYNFIPNDIFSICEALDIPYTPDTIKEISSCIFSNPLSPDQAARAENMTQIEFPKLVRFCTKARDADYLLIEGAGGVMTPINRTNTFLNLIQKTSEEVILVAGSYLGSITHTLTAYQTLKDNFKQPALLVISQNLTKSDELYIPVMETIKSLEKFVTSPIIGLERFTGNETTKTNKLSEILIDAKILKIIG